MIRNSIRSILAAAVCSTAIGAESPPARISEFTGRYCIECHSADVQKGDFRIDTLPWSLTKAHFREQWDLVYEYVSDGDMPTKKASKQPTAAERKDFLDALDAEMVLAAEGAKPGGTPLRRLNRIEYLNTVRDLFGIPTIQLPLSFPEDVPSAEFDTMPEGLFLSPAVMAAYQETAITVADRVAPLPGGEVYEASYDVLEIGGDEIRTWYGPKLEKLKGQFWKRQKNREFLMFTGFNNSGWTGALWDPLFLAPASGFYRLKLRANAQGDVGADGRPLRLSFHAFDPRQNQLPKRQRREWTRRVAELEVPVGEPAWIECLVPVEAGETFHIYCDNRFPNDKFPGEDARVSKNKVTDWVRRAMADPAPTIELRGMTVEGPVDVLPRVTNFFGTWPPKLDRDELESKLLPLAARAYRRPLTEPESGELISAVLEHGEQTGKPEFAWHFAIRRILSSPEFLYRESDKTEQLDDFALASRLSFFLWSTMPDSRLFEVARAGKLSDQKILGQQVRRMLKDPRSQEFVKHFTGQWLGNRDVAAINVCDNRYQWDENVRYGFLRSTEMFFEEVLREDLPISTFIDSDFTYANSAMRAVWKFESVKSLEFVAAAQRHSQIWPEPVRLDLKKLPRGAPDHVAQRGGVLGLPGVLTVTGDGVESSPILRGVWVLENLFGHHPPPPPKDVPALDIDTSKATNVRETLKAHTEIASCAKCHRDIDPLGLTLENYDAIGGWRTAYPGKVGSAIDPKSKLPDGTTLDGATSIKQHLLANREVFTHCLLTKLLEYGAGRKLSVGDKRVVEALVNAEPEGGYRFQELIEIAIKSEVFRTR